MNLHENVITGWARGDWLIKNNILLGD